MLWRSSGTRGSSCGSGSTYLLLILPFFFGGGAIGLAFSRFSHEIGRVYAFDLVGAGLGALGIVGVLFVLSPTAALRLIAARASSPPRWRWLHRACARSRAGRGACGRLRSGSAYGCRRADRASSAHLASTRACRRRCWCPTPGSSRSAPARSASSASSKARRSRSATRRACPSTTSPSRRRSSASSPTPNRSARSRSSTAISETLNYLDYTTSALPYHLLDRPKVLVLGAGGGEQVLLALYHGAREIDAVELNPQVLDLVAEDYADFAGRIYDRPEVDVHVGEARSFVRRTRSATTSSRSRCSTPSPRRRPGRRACTRATPTRSRPCRTYLAALQPGGLLAITLWLKLPPRDTPKLFATAVEALERLGVDDPGRSWR